MQSDTNRELQVSRDPSVRHQRTLLVESPIVWEYAPATKQFAHLTTPSTCCISPYSTSQSSSYFRTPTSIGPLLEWRGLMMLDRWLLRIFVCSRPGNSAGCFAFPIPKLQGYFLGALHCLAVDCSLPLLPRQSTYFYFKFRQTVADSSEVSLR